MAISDKEFAILAAEVFKKDEGIDVGIIGWSTVGDIPLLEAYKEVVGPDLQAIPFKSLWGDFGFFAGTYENASEVVVAVRGTNSPDDFSIANPELADGAFDRQYLFGYFYIQFAKAYAELTGKAISFTGHSLGGALDSTFAAREGTDTATGSAMHGNRSA